MPNDAPPTDWVTNNHEQNNEVARPPAAIPHLPPLVIITNAPAVKSNTPPAVTKTKTLQPATVPVFSWSSLNRWAIAHRLAQPHLLTKSPLTTYGISSSKGNMVLAIGSREAAWNGVTLHLGFAPEFIDDQVFIHGMDLQKNLEPLLIGPPLTPGSNRVVVIDPGHGGINGGTVSVLDKRAEKDFTLDWARRMKPRLEANGWQVILTRTNDSDMALSNRVMVAEAHHADLFISLHFNSVAPDQRPAGLATVCLTPMGLPSNLTRGYPDIVSQSFPNNDFDAQNLQLAERLQRALLHATAMEDRGVNRARFTGVLRGQHRPAVLIEAGFLSNPSEARRIADPMFRQKLAETVANAL